jgi:hypothetical protein
MWLERIRRFWNQHLDALATELARQKRERRSSGDTDRPADGSTIDTPSDNDDKEHR